MKEEYTLAKNTFNNHRVRNQPIGWYLDLHLFRKAAEEYHQSRLSTILTEIDERIELRKEAGIDNEYDFAIYKEASDDIKSIIQGHRNV